MSYHVKNAIHNHNDEFEDDAIAQYMSTDFIMLSHILSVQEARKVFLSQLKSNDIPAQVFVVAGEQLCGVLPVKKLLQETNDTQDIRNLMEHHFFHVSPADERTEVISRISKEDVDIVPVVAGGKLVGCLTEREIAHLLEDEVTEDAQRQGAIGKTVSRNQPNNAVEEAFGVAVTAVCCRSLHQQRDPTF